MKIDGLWLSFVVIVPAEALASLLGESTEARSKTRFKDSSSKRQRKRLMERPVMTGTHSGADVDVEYQRRILDKTNQLVHSSTIPVLRKRTIQRSGRLQSQVSLQ